MTHLGRDRVRNGVLQGRVMIADDHPLVRDALRLVIQGKWPELQIDEVGSIAAVEPMMEYKSGYRLILLDLMLPDAFGFSGLIFLKRLMGDTPVVVISSRQDAQTVTTAHMLGAAGFIPKSTALQEMISAFERVLTGETYFPVITQATSGMVDIAEAGRKLGALSAGQLRVLLALADGKLNKQIAEDMKVTEATVKAHLTVIFRKLGVQNRTQAILAARPLLESGTE